MIIAIGAMEERPLEMDAHRTKVNVERDDFESVPPRIRRRAARVIANAIPRSPLRESNVLLADEIRNHSGLAAFLLRIRLHRALAAARPIRDC
jgi:hypothetical protein